MYIHNALLKEGYASFSLYILEYCDEKDLIKREQYYLDFLKPEYNILKKAGSSLGYKHTKEILDNMSSFKRGEKNPNFGKKLSEEIRAKISIAKIGKKHTEETRVKMSNSQGIAVNVLDLQTNITTKFLSGNHAAKVISCSPATLQKYLKSGKILKKRYILSKVMS